MAYDGESDYKYVGGRSSVPVTGGDLNTTWTESEIDEAVEAGEVKLEADVNDGREITNPEAIHAEAAAAWATFKLVLGMKSPDATTRGDSLDEGSERMDFAREVKDLYRSYVNSIQSSEQDEGRGTVDFEVANWNDPH